MEARRRSRVVRRVIGLALALAIVVIVAAGGGSHQHTLQVTVPEATGVIPGERVVQGGLTAGSVKSADLTASGEAHVVIGIDDAFWPLPQDSMLILRMGGTIKYTDRYVQLARGHASSDFNDAAVVPASQFVAPVEYDTAFNIFNAPTRAGLKSMVDNGGPLFTQAAPPFRAALNVTAPALAQVDAVFRDLAYDQQALSTLVGSTAHISSAVAASNPGLRTLMTGAADTFSSLASQSTALEQAIGASPTAFTAATRAADHLSTTLPAVSKLARRLDPGIGQLQAIAAPLSDTLRRLVKIEPTAVGTLRTIAAAGAPLASLLANARSTLMPRLGSISEQLAPQLNCIRPYTPEAISMLQEFVNGIMADGPSKPHVKVLHALITALPFPNAMPIDTEQLLKVFPDLRVNFPSVPGMSFNQPWFDPKCGITPANLDPAHDAEAHTFDPNGSKVVPYN